MHSPDISLPESTHLSALGIMHLKRYLHKCLLDRENKLGPEIKQREWVTDNTLLNALGLELAQTLSFIYRQCPSIEQMENWVIETVGAPASATIQRFNSFITHGSQPVFRDAYTSEAVLNSEDIEHWNQQGYVILRDAVSKSDCAEAVQAICRFLDVDEHDPATWDNNHLKVNGIKVNMFRHPAIDKLRSSERIRIAFEQLWSRKDIWLKTDSTGFNPPANMAWSYQGHKLHWDTSLQMPIPFSTQGILYLTDTSADQGALAVVPGFHHQIDEWLSSLPPGANPREQDLEQLGAEKIAANTGDLIIWHQALPHGSTPNRSNKPRFVQYINYLPADREIRTGWI
jgi:ectoine hydroxylase-related dioxygenase (phytanoyl-CoA dioxygenase family)